MNLQDIEDALVREVAVILDTQPDSVDAMRPLPDMGIDSMSFVELLVFIERTFCLKLIQSGLRKEDFHTLRALAARIADEAQAERPT